MAASIIKIARQYARLALSNYPPDQRLKELLREMEDAPSPKMILLRQVIVAQQIQIDAFTDAFNYVAYDQTPQVLEHGTEEGEVREAVLEEANKIANETAEGVKPQGLERARAALEIETPPQIPDFLAKKRETPDPKTTPAPAGGKGVTLGRPRDRSKWSAKDFSEWSAEMFARREAKKKARSVTVVSSANLGEGPGPTASVGPEGPPS